MHFYTICKFDDNALKTNVLYNIVQVFISLRWPFCPKKPLFRQNLTAYSSYNAIMLSMLLKFVQLNISQFSIPKFHIRKTKQRQCFTNIKHL